jgi:hypothetical protein
MVQVGLSGLRMRGSQPQDAPHALASAWPRAVTSARRVGRQRLLFTAVNKRCALISVDLQNDFASEGGRLYSPKPCLAFLRYTLFPYLETAGLQMSEIVSDYRQPRPGYTKGCCEPGGWGHESIVPSRLTGSRLTKSMNSPVWTREGIGEADEEPGLPYSDPERFTAWLESGLGRPRDVVPVVFGLTVDCCVLCVAQELFWRGYETLILRQGVDCASGRPEDRDAVIETTIQNWANVIEWHHLEFLLARGGSLE